MTAALALGAAGIPIVEHLTNLGELPPTGVWVSYKGERSYVYDLRYSDSRALGGS